MDRILTYLFPVPSSGTLAIKGNDLPIRYPKHAFDPAHKAIRECFRFDQAEHATKGIVRRNAVRQFQKTSPPPDFGFPIRLDFTPRVCSTYHPAHGDKDDVYQPMLNPSLHAWIGHFPKLRF